MAHFNGGTPKASGFYQDYDYDDNNINIPVTPIPKRSYQQHQPVNSNTPSKINRPINPITPGRQQQPQQQSVFDDSAYDIPSIKINAPKTPTQQRINKQQQPLQFNGAASTNYNPLKHGSQSFVSGINDVDETIQFQDHFQDDANHMINNIKNSQYKRGTNESEQDQQKASQFRFQQQQQQQPKPTTTTTPQYRFQPQQSQQHKRENGHVNQDKQQSNFTSSINQQQQQQSNSYSQEYIANLQSQLQTTRAALDEERTKVRKLRVDMVEQKQQYQQQQHQQQYNHQQQEDDNGDDVYYQQQQPTIHNYQQQSQQHQQQQQQSPIQYDYFKKQIEKLNNRIGDLYEELHQEKLNQKKKDDENAQEILMLSTSNQELNDFYHAEAIKVSRLESEKRILEEENNYFQEQIDDLNIQKSRLQEEKKRVEDRLNQKDTELDKERREIASLRKIVENRDTVIGQKEFENQELAQKIHFYETLDQDITELKQIRDKIERQYQDTKKEKQDLDQRLKAEIAQHQRVAKELDELKIKNAETTDLRTTKTKETVDYIQKALAQSRSNEKMIQDKLERAYLNEHTYKQKILELEAKYAELYKNYKHSLEQNKSNVQNLESQYQVSQMDQKLKLNSAIEFINKAMPIIEFHKPELKRLWNSINSGSSSSSSISGGFSSSSSGGGSSSIGDRRQPISPSSATTTPSPSTSTPPSYQHRSASGLSSSYRI